MVGTEEPLLEVPDGAISEGHHGLRSLVQLGSQGLSARDVGKDSVQTREGLEAIGENRRTGSNVLEKEAIDGDCFEARVDGQAAAPRGSPAILHSDQKSRGSARP